MIRGKTFELLDKLSISNFFKENEIFLVGGTAIAFHSQHRVSYDVVFLMKNYNFSAKTIIETVQKHKYKNMFSTIESIMLMDTILRGRKPDQNDLDFEGIHSAAMDYKDYRSLKDYLREKISSRANIEKDDNG